MTTEAGLLAIAAALENIATALAGGVTRISGRIPSGPVGHEPVKQPAKDTAPNPPAPPPPQPAKEPATELSYESVRVPFLKLSTANRAAALEILEKLGFKTMKEAKPEQYAAIIKLIAARQAELDSRAAA